MIKHGHTEAEHRFSLPHAFAQIKYLSDLVLWAFWLILIPRFIFLSLNNSPRLPPPPRSPMVKLCWALQESNEGTANQRGSRGEGAYKITILGSKTIGCVCGEGKKKWIWRNSVEQEEAGKESEQRRRKEWEEWEQGDGWGGGIFFSLLDKSVLRVHSPLRVALPKSCLSNKN